MRSYLSRFFNPEGIPYGVRLLTAVTSIRWIGWGFAESLLPIFIFSFGKTYAEAGLLRGAYDIAFIIALPIVGVLGDRMRGKALVSIGLLIYLFVGTGYLLAGVTGLAIFIIFSRFFNGLAFAFDTVGRETYFRRHVPAEKLATAFGYFDTIANFWWIVAALVGIVLVKYFSIPVLLFMITPAALIAWYVLFRFDNHAVEHPKPASQAQGGYRDILKEIAQWNWTLRTLALFNFWVAFVGAVVIFFLPIELYAESNSLIWVIGIGVVSTLPSLGGWLLGKWFDVKGSQTFTWGLLAFAILLVSLVYIDSSAWKVLVSFFVGIILEFLSVGSNELITVYANPEHFGRMDGIMRSISDIGSMMGPLAVGIIIDSQGAHTAFLILSILLFVLAALFQIMKSRLKLSTMQRMLS